MNFKKLNREGSEQVFRTVYNVEGATITTGLPVSVKPGGASINGVNAVVANAAGDLPGFIGIAMENIANNDYGLVQVNGLVNSVLLSNAGTSITYTAGDMLIPGPAGFTSVGVGTAYSGNGALTYNFKSVVNVDTATVSAVGYARGLINVL